MTNLISATSRFVLFGGESSEVNIHTTIGQIILSKLNYWGRRLIGLQTAPPLRFRDYLWSLAAHDLRILSGNDQKVALPADLPRKLFATIDEVLRNRGGAKNDLPLFWASAKGAISSPFFWSILVDYQPTADPASIRKMEESLEDAITRAGYDYNIRIQSRPLRIEIDKPKPPLVRLADHWSYVSSLPQNQRIAFCGLTWLRGQSAMLTIQMAGEDFSAFIAGSPGSGKTQLSMSLILSLAMSNSPSTLSMVIIDPKSIDWRPLNDLPHLAMPVINEPTRAAEVIQGLVNEMDSRTQRAAQGDTSFLQNAILLYVDELSDLLNSLPGVAAERSAMGLQRLAQKGRGVGFIAVGATQRVYDVPASAYTKLNARFVGKMRNANDSVAASGIPGTQTNRLPGRGSFELYCSDQTGLRIQAPFVADSQQANYAEQIAFFVNAIKARWGTDTPGATFSPNSDAPTEPPPDAEQPRVDIPVELFTRLQSSGRVSQYQLRQWHRELLGRDLNPAKAKSMLDALFGDAESLVMQ